MTRGTEWYVMRSGRIAEVRAYFIVNPEVHTELETFPYAQRGYLTVEAAQSRSDSGAKRSPARSAGEEEVDGST